MVLLFSPRGELSKCDLDSGNPVWIEVDIYRRIIEVTITEEWSCQTSHPILCKRYVELTFAEYVINCILGRDLQVNRSLGIMQNRIEVELLLPGCDIERHLLFAVDSAKTRSGIESPAASRIVEPQFLHIERIFVCDGKAAERRDATKGNCVRLRFCTDGYMTIIQECICESLGIGKPNLRRVCHRRVPVAAMCHYHQLVFPLFELKGCRTVVCKPQLLVYLLDSRACHIIYYEIHPRTDIGNRSARIVQERYLFYLGDAHYEIAFQF